MINKKKYFFKQAVIMANKNKNKTLSNTNCTVYGCSNTYRTVAKEGRQISFYSFPSRPWMQDRRKKWILFANRVNNDGTPWVPSKFSTICADHFVGGWKSEHPGKPNYNPTLIKGKPFKITETTEDEEQVECQEDAVYSDVDDTTSTPPPVTSKECLLCFSPCLSDPYTRPVGGDGSPVDDEKDAGTENCVLLHKQLRSWFILRKLLDVPKSWCEEMMETGGASKGENPDLWFQVCQKCSMVVTSAWTIHKQIVELAGRMVEIKRSIKEKIFQEYRWKFEANDDDNLGNGNDVDELALSIWRIAVPQLGAYDKDTGEEVDEMDVDIKVDQDADNLRPAVDMEDSGDILLPAEKDSVSEQTQDNDKQGGNQVEKVIETVDVDDEQEQDPVSTIQLPIQSNPNQPPGGVIYQTYIDIKMFKCQECTTFMSTAEDLEAHLKLHQKRKLKREVEGVADSLDCHKCAFPARDALELQSHILTRHDKPLRKHFQCTLCPCKNLLWRKFLAHFRLKHTSIPKSEIKSILDQYLKCPKCSFRGKIPRDLIRHLQSDHKEDQHADPTVGIPCEDCGILFSSEGDLQSHIYSVHKRAFNFICDECGADFSSHSSLASHKISHTNFQTREWICDVCGVDFGRRHNLRKHCRQYHSAKDDATSNDTETKETVFKCRHCDLTSPYNAVIKKHLQTHKEEKGIRCEQCGNYFISQSGLKTHIRLQHETAQQIPCPHCLKQFPSKMYMQNHVNRGCKLKRLKNQKMLI